MAIRKTNQAETDYILRLSGNVVQESTAGYAPNHGWNSYEMFSSLIKNGAYYLIDEENRDLRGWILLGRDLSQLTGELTGHLFHLYVFPQHRNKGIAKKLMQTAMLDLYNLGIYTVQLNVFAGNPAKNLYKKLGFRTVSTIMEYKLPKFSIGHM